MALLNYVFEIEDLRNETCESVHGTRLKFYRDSSLDTEAVISHVSISQTGMEAQRLMEFINTDEGIQARADGKVYPQKKSLSNHLRASAKMFPSSYRNNSAARTCRLVWSTRLEVLFTSKEGCETKPSLGSFSMTLYG